MNPTAAATTTTLTIRDARAFEFEDVQREVLEQHREIRARLHGLARAAARAVVGAASPFALSALRIALLRLAGLFDEHLAFEERELAPRIRVIDAWGGVREEAMLLEHVEQRRRLEQACAVADDFDTNDNDDDAHGAVAQQRELGAEVLSLVASFLDDMDREELELTMLAELDRFGWSIDQLAG